MKKTVPEEGVVRVVLRPEDTAGFEPLAFADAAGTFLKQTGFRCAERPVYRLDTADGEGNVRQTANGEVVAFEENGTKQLRMSHSAELRFTCPEGEVLTGLG